METVQRAPWTRISYDIYSDPEIYEREQERIFRGRSWNYVGLEAEIPRPGDTKRTGVGDRRVVVARETDGSIRVRDHRRDLHVTTRHGVIFASYAADIEPLEAYLGEKILPYFDRMFDGRELRVLGYWRQRIACNWKLIVENIRDPYHATLLHVFLVTFGLNRADQPGRAILDEHGRHGAMMNERLENHQASEEVKREMKSLLSDLKLEGPKLLDVVREFPGSATLVMQTIWPNIILQQQSNAVAIRQIVTTGDPGAFEFHWTVYGYVTDDEAMTRRRLRLANLMGPSGLVSVDDTEVIELTQKGAARFREAEGIIEMGGSGTGDVDYTVTEAPLRAFHKYYREVMGL